MFKKTFISFVTAGVLVATAAASTYKVSLTDAVNVDGKQLKVGDYKIELTDSNSAVIKGGGQEFQVSVHEQSAPKKFDTTATEFDSNKELKEIHVGGTHTILVFGNAAEAATDTK